MSVTLKDVGSGYKRTAINSNFDAIETEINNNLLNKNGGVGLEADLDANSQKVINLADGVLNQDAVTVRQLSGAIAAAGSGLIASQKEVQTGADVVGNVTTFTGITYTVGGNNLFVFRNGNFQTVGIDYTETSSSSITWTTAPNSTDGLTFITNLATTNSTTDTSAITHTESGADYNLANYLQNRHVANIKDFGASTGASAATNVAAIQAAYDTGKHVMVPNDGAPFDINATITGATEGQITFGGGTIRATAAITMFEHTTNRYQRITDNVVLDGNNIATYCYKASFPKCGLSGAECNKAVTANAWLGHFSTFIDQNSRIITGDGIGVLIQDGVGEVNDIRVRDSIVSGNAQHGIRLATANRDGIWVTGNNMENNCTTAGGYSHMSSVSTSGLHFHNNYMENSLSVDADGSFVNIESGVETLVIDSNKMNDSATTTPFNYCIRLATSGGDLLRRAVISNNWADGYGLHFIENGMNSGVNNYLSLRNNNILNNTTDTLISDGTGIDIIEPVRTSLSARRVTSNQTFSTATAAIFNEAQDTTTQASVDIRTLPAAYSLSTGVYTVFESGKYKVSGVISVTAPGSGIYATATIKKGGTVIYGPFYSEGGDGSKNVSLPFEGTVVCAAGDTLSVDIESSSGNLDMRLNGSSLSIEKIGTNFGQQA